MPHGLFPFNAEIYNQWSCSLYLRTYRNVTHALSLVTSTKTRQGESFARRTRRECTGRNSSGSSQVNKHFSYKKKKASFMAYWIKCIQHHHLISLLSCVCSANSAELSKLSQPSKQALQPTAIARWGKILHILKRRREMRGKAHHAPAVESHWPWYACQHATDTMVGKGP